MAIDMFATRTMLQAIELMFLPKTFLLDTFFKTVETSTTEFVDIDIIKRKRRLAPFVSPLHQGKIIDRSGYVTRTFKPPYIKEKMPFSGADLLKRQAGETIYQGNMTPDQRAAQQLGKDLQELIDMITRREEWMAAQALTTGKVRCTGEGIDVEIDFLMSATHNITLTGTELWTDAGSDPVADLRDWKRLVGKDSGLVPDVVVMGESVIQPFLLNSTVQKLIDTTKIRLGQIDPRALPNGSTFWGNLEGLDIYTYDEWYLDDAGVLQPMVPIDRIIMGASRARSVRHYGAIQDLKATASVRYFPKSWEEEDPSVRWIMVQSAPIPVPHEIDAFLTAKVV